MAFIGEGSLTSGAMPATVKNRFAEHQADNAGADMLKSALCGSGFLFEIQNPPIRPSRATITVPAAGPYNKTAVKTKVSEIEIEANEEGSLTVADPLTNVSAARINQRLPIGSTYR